jgi:hypothetical protein
MRGYSLLRSEAIRGNVVTPIFIQHWFMRRDEASGLSLFVDRRRLPAGISAPDEAVAAEREAGGVEAGLPAVAGADGGGVGQEAVGFFLLGEPGEFGVERMVGGEDCNAQWAGSRCGRISRVRSKSLKLRSNAGCRSASNSVRVAANSPIVNPGLENSRARLL